MTPEIVDAATAGNPNAPEDVVRARVRDDDSFVRLAAEWLTSDQAAELLHVAHATWWSYVARGHAPAPCQHLGNTALWSKSDVEAWQANRRGQGRRKSS